MLRMGERFEFSAELDFVFLDGFVDERSGALGVDESLLLEYILATFINNYLVNLTGSGV